MYTFPETVCTDTKVLHKVQKRCTEYCHEYLISKYLVLKVLVAPEAVNGYTKM